VPEGPSEETRARTLAALRAAAARPDPIHFLRRRTMLTFLKFAAAAVLIGGGLFYLTMAPEAEATAAFAEVAEKLRDAHTFSFLATTQAPGLKEPMVIRYLYKEPGLMRSESPGGGPVTIFDTSRGKLLILDPSRKSALLMEGPAPKGPDAPRDIVADTVKGMRTLGEKKGEPVGRERIGGVEAEGFRVVEGGNTLVVWVDAKTRLPLRIDVTTQLQGQAVRGTLTELALDPPLDDSLFRLEAPDGYTVQKARVGALLPSPEEVVSQLLRAYSEKLDGTFPAKLDDAAAFAKLFPPKQPGQSPVLDPEFMELTLSLTRVLLLSRELKDYGYKADGVKRGDADKIVFWYRPAGAEKYRALYGDLHVGDVTADQLPERPRP
jgi:outer membrane lipoprotein-sorting protein